MILQASIVWHVFYLSAKELPSNKKHITTLMFWDFQ